MTMQGRYEPAFGSKIGPTVIETENPLIEPRKAAVLTKDNQIELAFKAYSGIVEIYTSRFLSQECDILNAFSGMLSALHEYFDSGDLNQFASDAESARFWANGAKVTDCFSIHTVSGLPNDALGLALLWTPAQTLTRREAKRPIE